MVWRGSSEDSFYIVPSSFPPTPPATFYLFFSVGFFFFWRLFFLLFSVICFFSSPLFFCFYPFISYFFNFSSHLPLSPSLIILFNLISWLIFLLLNHLPASRDHLLTLLFFLIIKYFLFFLPVFLLRSIYLILLPHLGFLLLNFPLSLFLHFLISSPLYIYTSPIILQKLNS